jgi:hypothetical protein
MLARNSPQNPFFKELKSQNTANMGLTGAPLGLAALRSTRRSSRISGFRRKVTCHKGVVEILLRWVCHASDAWKKPVNVPSVPVPPRQHRYPPLQRTQGWGTLCGNGVGKTAKVGHPPPSSEEVNMSTNAGEAAIEHRRSNSRFLTGPSAWFGMTNLFLSE